MLARTYKTARQLRIRQKEYDALLRTKEMLERGEAKWLRDVDGKLSFEWDAKVQIDAKKFNMGIGGGALADKKGRSCGTVGCIGGWMACYLGAKTACDMDGYVGSGHSDPLTELFYPHSYGGEWSDISPKRAVAAIENFLTTGDPKWEEVMGVEEDAVD